MQSQNLELTLGQASDGHSLAYTAAFTNDEGRPDLRVVTSGHPPIDEPIRSFLNRPGCAAQPWLRSILGRHKDHLDPGLVSLGSVKWTAGSREDYSSGKATAEQPATLFSRLVTYMRRFYWAPDAAHYSILALYVMMTYVFTLFGTVPYLLVLGEPSTGKTVLATLLEHLAFSARQAAAISSAALYGYLDCTRGTVILDEQYRGNAVWMNVLLAGYRSSGAVMTCDRGTNLPVSRNTFGPKILVTNNPLSDTALESRVIELRAQRSPAPLERFSPSRESHDLALLRDDLHVFGLSWAEAIADEYWTQGDEVELSHRDADLAAPLLSIATIADSTATGSALRQQVVDFLRREAERKKLAYIIEGDVPALARAIMEFCTDEKWSKKQVAGRPGFYLAQDFTEFVNEHRFLDRTLQTRELSRKLNQGDLVIERAVVDLAPPVPGSVDPFRREKRKQRRAYRFNEDQARQICGVMP